MNRRDTLKIMAGASIFAYVNLREPWIKEFEKPHIRPISLANIDGEVHALFASRDKDGNYQLPCDYDKGSKTLWIRMSLHKSDNRELYIWNKCLTDEELKIFNENREQVWKDYVTLLTEEVPEENTI